MKKKLIASLVLGVIVVSSGCSTVKSKPDLPKKTPEQIEKHEVSNALVSEARQIKDLMVKIADYEASKKPVSLDAPSWPNEAEFTKHVTIANYSGGVDKLLDTVSKIIGYKFVEVGKKSIVPIVHIDYRDVPAGKIIRDVGSRIEKYADIVVDVKSKTLTVIYKK